MSIQAEGKHGGFSAGKPFFDIGSSWKSAIKTLNGGVCELNNSSGFSAIMLRADGYQRLNAIHRDSPIAAEDEPNKLVICKDSQPSLPNESCRPFQ